MYEALFLHLIKVYRGMDDVRWAKVSAFTAREEAKVRGGVAPFEGELTVKRKVEWAQSKIDDARRFLACMEGEDIALSFMKKYLIDMESILAGTRVDLFAGKYR